MYVNTLICLYIIILHHSLPEMQRSYLMLGTMYQRLLPSWNYHIVCKKSHVLPHELEMPSTDRGICICLIAHVRSCRMSTFCGNKTSDKELGQVDSNHLPSTTECLVLKQKMDSFVSIGVCSFWANLVEYKHSFFLSRVLVKKIQSWMMDELELPILLIWSNPSVARYSFNRA